MTNKLEISRELAERLIKGDASKGANALRLVDAWKAMDELRALLAAPVVERQEPVGYIRECHLRNLNIAPLSKDSIPLYRHPPEQTAPVAVALEKIDDICERFELEGLHTHPTYKQFKKLFAELKLLSGAKP